MNHLAGNITEIRRSGAVTAITLRTQAGEWTAFVLEDQAGQTFQIGEQAGLVWKETAMQLAMPGAENDTTTNSQPATIITIENGEILSLITLDLAGNKVTAIVDKTRVDQLQLIPQQEISIKINATDIALRKEAEK